MSTIESNTINIQRSEAINSLSGRFVYRKFQKNEYTDEDADETKQVDGFYNRWIKLDIGEGAPIKSGWLLNLTELTLGVNIPSESDLNLGVIKAVTISRDENKYIKSFFGPNPAGRSPYQEFLIAYLNGQDVGQWPEFAEDAQFPEVDITTGKFVMQQEINPDYFQGPSWLSEYTVDAIAGSIVRNPLSEDTDAYKFYEMASLVSRKRSSEKNKRLSESSIANILSGSINELSIDQLPLNGDFEDGDLLGFAILKYSGNEFMSMHITDSREFYDYNIKYGEEYRYIVLPVKATPIGGPLSPIICNNEISITIEAREEIPPAPPETIMFKWLERDLYNIAWNFGAKRVSITRESTDTNGQDTFEEEPDDIKGVQIFVRESLLEPYTLIRYIDFNDVEPAQYRELAKEIIPAEYILRVNPASAIRKTQYNTRLRSNSDHYIALCTIDAHGNSSAYSAQYKLRRNSVTGEVNIMLVSPAGAPKTQPNLLLKEPLVESSFTAHRYTHASIYVNPDLASNCPDDGQSVQFEFLDVNSDTSDNFFISIKTQN